jgi:hypothetical protein
MSRQKQFVKEVERRAGVVFSRVEMTGGNHLRAYVEGCSKTFILPLTASDHRAILNAAGDIKRTLRNDSR